jgi:hypothetical protein
MSEERATPADDEPLGSGLRFFMAIAIAVTFTIFAMQPFLHLPGAVRVALVLAICACSSAWAVVGYLRRPGGVRKTGKWLAALVAVVFVVLIFLVTFAAALLSVVLFYI